MLLSKRHFFMGNLLQFGGSMHKIKNINNNGYGLNGIFKTAIITTVYFLGFTTKAHAGSMTINLQAGKPFNVLLNVTELSGVDEPLSLVIKYPQKMQDIIEELKASPQLIGQYSTHEPRKPYHMISNLNDTVVERFHNGRKDVNDNNGELLTSFLYSEGQLKFKQKNFLTCTPQGDITNEGKVYAVFERGESAVYAISHSGSLSRVNNYRFSDSDKLIVYSDRGVWLSDSGRKIYMLYDNELCSSSKALGRKSDCDVVLGVSTLYGNQSVQCAIWESLDFGNDICNSPLSSMPLVGYLGVGAVVIENDFLYADYLNGVLHWKNQYQYRTSFIFPNRTSFIFEMRNQTKSISMADQRNTLWSYPVKLSKYFFPTIANDGTILLLSADNELLEISSKVKIFKNHEVFHASPEMLKVFDIRHLNFSGIPKLNATLEVEVKEEVTPDGKKKPVRSLSMLFTIVEKNPLTLASDTRSSIESSTGIPSLADIDDSDRLRLSSDPAIAGCFCALYQHKADHSKLKTFASGESSSSIDDSVAVEQSSVRCQQNRRPRG